MKLHETIFGGSCHNYDFCYDKSFVVFVATKDAFSRDKHVFVFVATKLCLSVATNMCLSRQNTQFAAKITCLSRQKYVRCDKAFVVTKIVFVAARANDVKQIHHCTSRK